MGPGVLFPLSESPLSEKTSFRSLCHRSGAAPPFFVHVWAQAGPGDEDGHSAAETEVVHRGGSQSPHGRGLKEYLSARYRSRRFFLFRHFSYLASWHPFFILVLAPHKVDISILSDFIHNVEEISHEGQF
jgi:hypothetical protein